MAEMNRRPWFGQVNLFPVRHTARRLWLTNRMEPQRNLLLALLAGSFAACSEGSGVISDPVSQSVVYGQVRDSSGAPLGGAVVSGRGFRGAGCADVAAFGSPDTTDSQGRYHLALAAFFSRAFTGCAEVVVRDSLGVTSDTVRVFGVSFVEGPVQDSTHVDLVVRAGA